MQRDRLYDGRNGATEALLSYVQADMTRCDDISTIECSALPDRLDSFGDLKIEIVTTATGLKLQGLWRVQLRQQSTTSLLPDLARIFTVVVRLDVNRR